MVLTITEDTIKIIDEINQKLKRKCPSLEIKINKKGIQHSLSLEKAGRMMSHLIIQDDNNTYNILSTTEPRYEGRKYNKLLTAVSIVIASSLNGPSKLFSNTSVAARKKILEYYEIESKIRIHDYYYMPSSKSTPKSSSEEEKTYDYLINMKLPKNQEIANRIINETIRNLNCSDSKGGAKSKKNIKKQRRQTKRRV
jgi:hypothetical protein